MRSRRRLLVCSLCCLGFIGASQSKALDENVHALIAKKAEGIFASLTEVRRDLHQNPELSGQERRTSALVADYLSGLGLEVKSRVGGFGVVGILRGEGPGPVVAWRADMDALADSSPDEVSFKSIAPGLKHSCGHDVHTTIALGIANVLSSLKSRLRGTVLFVLQPSEENFRGAEAMLADGLFGLLKPEAVLALHLVPLPAGVVSVKPAEMFSSRVRVTIELKDVSCAELARGVCAGLLEEMNAPPGLNVFSISLDDSEKGPFNPQTPLAGFFAIQGQPRMERKGDAGCIVVASALSSSRADIDSAVGKLKEAFSRSILKDNVRSIEYAYSQPPVYNDPRLTAQSKELIQSLYGKGALMPLYGVIPGFNDDFALFQERIKGTYFLLGGSNFEKGIVSMPHTPNFEVEESCIKAGTALFSSLLYELLRK